MYAQVLMYIFHSLGNPPARRGFDVRRDRLWVKYRGKRLLYVHTHVGGGSNQRKKEKKKVPRYIEFSDSLGDSEVVRVLGNAVHNTYHFKRQQAVQSMHIHSQSLSASRRNRCYARRKSWVKKFARPVNASI